MKNTTAALIFASAALFLTGCESQQQYSDNLMPTLVYTIDLRTNLCFAANPHDWTSFTEVPCSPQVLKQIDLGRSND